MRANALLSLMPFRDAICAVGYAVSLCGFYAVSRALD
jgi:hypothetical protein